MVRLILKKMRKDARAQIAFREFLWHDGFLDMLYGM